MSEVLAIKKTFTNIMKTGAKGTDVLLISGRHQFKKYRKK